MRVEMAGRVEDMGELRDRTGIGVEICGKQITWKT
jgi:hypothetical protein